MKITRRTASFGAALIATLGMCAWTALYDDSGATADTTAVAPGRSRPAAVHVASLVDVPASQTPFERDPLVDAAIDPFAPVSFVPQPPVAAPVERTVATVIVPPPSAPVAPPFPYRYVGRMTGIDGKTGVYIASDQELLQVRAGQTVAGTFRIDTIDDRQIALTYLPLEERVILPTPTAAQ